MYVENDVDSGICLTPAHFISVNYKTGTPDVELQYTPNQDNRETLLRSWKKGQVNLKQFLKSWLTEYLPSLRERYNVVMKSIKGELDRIPRIGEVVIVEQEGLPRGRWKIARVMKLMRSDIDGLERAAKLQFPSGYITCRPLRLLYPLEYAKEDNEETSSINKCDESFIENDNKNVNERAQRCSNCSKITNSNAM